MHRHRGFILNEILDELDKDLPVDLQQANFIDIHLIPGDNANDEVTDEDSGDEENVEFDNLPPVLLTGAAEIKTNRPDSDTSDSEYGMPLDQLRKKVLAGRKKNWRKWKKIDLPSSQCEEDDHFEEENVPSPLEIFEKFIDEEFIATIVDFSNVYAARKNNIGNITSAEIKAWIGVLLLSGYNPVSRRRMYWEVSKDARNELVANSMSRDRFDFILANIRFVDNNLLDKGDKFAKVRPLVKMLNNRFLQHAPKLRTHSVDEQMAPYYGGHCCKQYLHGKPIRYGYKFWIGATHKGYIVWLEPYQGACTFVGDIYKEMGLGASVVLTYADVLKKLNMKGMHLYFDNLFTSLPLLVELRARGFNGTGTIRENRLVNCPLPKKKDVINKERGWHDYRSSNGIIVCSYNDNNVVNISSTLHGMEPAHSTSRWSKKEKKYLTLKQPDIIYNYNQYMGGVDRADQNISLYRVAIVIKRGNSSFLSRAVRYDRIDHLLDEIPRNPNGKIKQLTCRQCHKKCSTKCIKCDIPLHASKCNVEYHTGGNNN